MALRISRRSTDCGRPPGLGWGIRGWTSFHWASVRSVGYFARLIPFSTPKTRGEVHFSHRLLAVSPATIDRLLAPIRGTAGRRRKRKPATKSSRQIPIRTFADWKEPEPGFLEVDFVAHCGDSMQGTFLWSLVATDVCSGWTEAVPLVAREQFLVIEGLAVMRRQFPVPIRGIDTDNDSAFINETLQGYCQEQQLEFTRSRAYQENDQTWIEQKNGSVIRRFVGYHRFSGLVAGQCLARLYRAVRLDVNYSDHH